MFRRFKGPVLAAVDFSPHSEAALAWAAHFAAQNNAELVILHVVHEPAEDPGFYAKLLEDSDSRPGGENEMRTMEEVAEEAMARFLGEAAARLPELRTPTEPATRVVAGVPATRIIEYAGSIEARLIVMGSHGRKGLEHFLIGSVAEEVVRRSPLPVTVRQNAIRQFFRRYSL